MAEAEEAQEAEGRVDVESRGAVRVVRFNRPRRRNAFDVATIRAFQEAVEAAASDDAVRCVLVTGAGEAFCAGGDVTAMEDADDPEALFRSLTEHHHAAVLRMATMDKPVVTAINGAAAGGGFGIALAGDLRVASERAKFKPAYPRLGVVPDGGLTWLLPRVAGVARAQEILLLDELVDVRTAYGDGLVHRVVPPGELFDEALRVAHDLTNGPLFSMGRTKRLLARSLANGLEAQLDLEREWNAQSAATEDFREGLAAFMEGREPVFRQGAGGGRG